MKTLVKKQVSFLVVAAAVLVVIATVLFIDSNKDTNQNVQPEITTQQEDKGTGDGSINNTTPNSGQSQVQDSEGTSPNIPAE